MTAHWIRVVTNEGVQRVGASWLEVQSRIAKLIPKGMGLRDQLSTYLEMSLMEMW